MIARITLSRVKAAVLALALVSALLLLFVANSRADVTTFTVGALEGSGLVAGCEPPGPCTLRGSPGRERAS